MKRESSREEAKENRKKSSKNIQKRCQRTSSLICEMAYLFRYMETADEEALLAASANKDVLTLTSLLRKGVCPNFYDNVWRFRGRDQRESEEEKRRKRGRTGIIF